MEKLAGFEAANLIVGKKKAIRKKKPAAAREPAEVKERAVPFFLLDTYLSGFRGASHPVRVNSVMGMRKIDQVSTQFRRFRALSPPARAMTSSGERRMNRETLLIDCSEQSLGGYVLKKTMKTK